MITLNAAETEALVRNLDGITECDAGLSHIRLERRDSFDKPYEGGFLILRLETQDGLWAEDAISEAGMTSHWGQGSL